MCYSGALRTAPPRRPRPPPPPFPGPGQTSKLSNLFSIRPRLGLRLFLCYSSSVNGMLKLIRVVRHGSCWDFSNGNILDSVGLFGSMYWKGLESSSVFKQASTSNLS